MAEGIVWIIKAVILTEVLTNAVRTWGIFDPPRQWLKVRVDFIRRLLDCFECTSIWSAFIVLFYLTYWEWKPLTYALILHRGACFLQIAWLNLDAARANKEADLSRKLEGK